MAYLSLLAETLPDISVYSLSPGLNEAVRSSEYDYWHDLHVQRISEIEAEMKKAEEPELTQWKNTLEIWQCQLDDIENGATDRGWTMSEGSIASYRSHAENLNVDSGYGLSQDAFRVITGLFDQYNDGLLSADELLADVDERINMMLLEAK